MPSSPTLTDSGDPDRRGSTSERRSENWVAEQMDHPREVIEAALAHVDWAEYIGSADCSRCCVVGLLAT